MCAPQFFPSYHSVTRISAAPVCSASAAGPPMIMAGSPKNSTSIPLPVRSRSHSRQTRPPARSCCARTSNLLAPPLRYCRDLSGAAEHDPGARVLPVAHVRQREDHPAAGRQVPERGLLLASRPHPAEDLRLRDHRQPECLQPVPQVGAHPVPRKPPQIHNGWIGADHPRQVRLQLPDARPLPPPQLVGGVPEQPLRPPPGHPANHAPAEQVQPGAHPLSHRAHPNQGTCCPPRALSRAPWPHRDPGTAPPASAVLGPVQPHPPGGGIAPP